jgi:hypothetical protein
MTFRTRLLTAAFTSLVASSIAGQALAEDAYPLVYGQRPIVLTKGLSQGQAAFSFLRPDVEGSDLFVSLDASYDFGLTEDLTVGVLAVPLALSPESAYGQPTAYGTLRLVDKEKYEVGAHAGLVFPGPNGGDLGLGAGLLGRIYLHKAAFLNVGALFNVTLSDPALTQIDIPFDLGVSFTRNLFFTLDTRFIIPEGEFDALILSSFAGLGYTVGQERPVIDLFVRGGFPTLLLAGVENYNLQVQVGGRYYFE